MTSQIALPVTVAFGFLAVALGAFGAHGLKELLESNGTTAIWGTASHYHLIHAVVLLVLATRPQVPAVSFWLFAAGITIFSGSLYVLAVSGVKALGAVTPVGGLALLVGWVSLLVARDLIRA